MFFDLILLKTQHKNKFGFAWIAATRGPNHIKKKDLLELKVSKLCDNIIEFLVTESQSPHKRFSLRLSTMLVNGTIKIFAKQALLLQNDVFSFYTQTHMPRMLTSSPSELETGIFPTPPSPVARVRTKRKKRADEDTATPIATTTVMGGGGVAAGSELSQVDRDAAEAVIEFLQEHVGVIIDPSPKEKRPRMFTARADDASIREEMPRTSAVIATIQEEIDTGLAGQLPEDEPLSKFLEPIYPALTPAEKTVEPAALLSDLLAIEDIHAMDIEQIPARQEEEIEPMEVEILVPPRGAALEMEVPSYVEKDIEEEDVKRNRKRKGKVSDSSPSEAGLPVKIAVEVQVHASKEGLEHTVPEGIVTEPVPLQREMQRSPPTQQVPESEIRNEREELEIDIQQVPQRRVETPEAIVIPKSKRPKKDPMAKFLVDMRPKRYLAIDRCAVSILAAICAQSGQNIQEGDLELFTPVEIIKPQGKLKECISSLWIYINQYSETDIDGIQRRHASKDTLSLRDSKSLRPPSSHNTSSELGLTQKSSLPQVHETTLTPQSALNVPAPPSVDRETETVMPVMPITREPSMEQLESISALPSISSTPALRRKRRPETTRETTTVETIAAAAQAPDQPEKSPVDIEHTVPVGTLETVIPQEEIIEEFIPIEPEAIPEKEPQPWETVPPPEIVEEFQTKDSVKHRQQKIIDIILAWKDTEDITLANVSQKPLNKLNVARAFGDLLVLCKAGYVQLIPEDGGTELMFIRKGPKLLRK